MTKRKSWTIFILLTLTLITLLIAPITVWYNLKHYSVYYAQHIPHKEEENPELVFIMKNLYFINKPADKDLEYIVDSHEISYLANKKGASFKYAASLSRKQQGKEGYKLFFYDYGSYHWDKNGKYQYFVPYHNDTENIRDGNEELSQIISPIIAIQPEPKMNLQWLFNWVHRDRFNQD